MSRPQKIHKPIKGAFNNILAAVAHGSGPGRRAAKRLADAGGKTIVNERQRAKPKSK